MDMSLIAGMPEVIAYIRSQDESIEALKAELDDVKEERDKYFGYLEDKDYECETQREYKEALEEENEKLKNTIALISKAPIMHLLVVADEHLEDYLVLPATIY